MEMNNKIDQSNATLHVGCDMSSLSSDKIKALDDYINTAKELFLLRIAKGEMKDLSKVDLQANQLQIPFDNHHYVVIVVSPDFHSGPVIGDIAISILEDRIRNDKFAEEHLLACRCDIQGQLTCIAMVKAPYMDTVKLESVLSVYLSDIKSEINVQLNYGIGAFVDRLELLSESYNLAKSVLEHAISLDNNGIFGKVNHYLKNGEDIHTQLLQLFRNGDITGIHSVVQQHVEMIRLNHPGRQVLIERFAVLYLQNITNECMRLGITLERFESYVPAVVCLMQLDGLGSIEYMLQLTEQILKYISVHRTKESNHLLTMAKDYIRANMANEKLDLATVGDYVGLSRVYFCKLFHQMEGISFSAYLKKVRIDKAKQLLLTTNMKVFEVGNAVGFSHAKYFGQVFKEEVGQTPLEFQKGIGRKN